MAKTKAIFLFGADLDFILFKTAIDAAEQGHGVWFISLEPLEKIPEGIIKPCKEVLKLITFIYLNDYGALVRHFNGVHKWQHLPSVIIVKDFDWYCNLNDFDLRKGAYLSAALVDGAQFLSKKRGSPAVVLVTCLAEGNLDRLQAICDMYFDEFVFKGEGTEETIRNSVSQFILAFKTCK